MGCCCSCCAEENGAQPQTNGQPHFNRQSNGGSARRTNMIVVDVEPLDDSNSCDDFLPDSGLSGSLIKRRSNTSASMKQDLMRVYAWGQNQNEELGLEANGPDVYQPTLLGASSRLKSIACGDSHTIFLLTDGTIETCGSNDHGQLGRRKGKGSGQSQPRPVRDGLKGHQIIAVSAGYAHSMALTAKGHVFAWGNNAHGQLGRNSVQENLVARPKLVESLKHQVIIQIATGHSHSLMLSQFGELYGCGANKNGQLCHPSNEDICEPSLLVLTIGFPIAFVTAGDFHSFAVSVSGAVIGWGKNSNGQLGVGDKEDKWLPTPLKTLISHSVRRVSAGSDHSAFLTVDGGVFTCGNGNLGQLGHSSYNCEVFPRKILEFGSAVSQVVCGFGNTHCIGASGKVYSFGEITGQLSPNVESNSPVHLRAFDESVNSIYAGSGHFFALLNNCEVLADVDDLKQILVFSEQSISNICSKINTKKNEDEISLLTNLLSSTASFNASFPLPVPVRLRMPSLSNSCINLDEAESVFAKLGSIKSPSPHESLIEECLLERLLPKFPFLGHIESLRVFVLVTLLPTFYDGKSFKLAVQLAHQTLNLPENVFTVIFSWLYNLQIAQLQRLVSVYKRAALSLVDGNYVESEDLMICLIFLQKLNQLNRKHQRLSYHVFTMPQLPAKIDIAADYVGFVINGLRISQKNLYFCGFPFLFDSHAKSLLLEVDQRIQMRIAMDKAAQAELVLLRLGLSDRGPLDTLFLNIVVSRDTIVGDTITRLLEVEPAEIKRPLRVKFIGEEAEDAGGVRKEFFLLLIRQILDQKFGMFKYHEESRLLWFNENSLEDVNMFFLVGSLAGLAIYNTTIIALPFPLALYKKLLGENVGMEDLRELEPSLAANLETMLEYKEDDLDDVFGLTFEYTTDNFGIISTVPLKPGWAGIPVTQSNKNEYVKLFIEHKLNKSSVNQFEAFKAGFERVCGGDILSLFYPEQLMEMVVGNEDYEWSELEENCTYEGGYETSSTPIVLFWQVFHDLSLTEKKRFLLFLSGSDRISIAGMKSLNMIIYRDLHQSEFHLPVAHTCSNQLDLPPYRKKETLRAKLVQAIQQNEGFSLV